MFNTHKYPDTYALFSICLVQYYLQNDALPKNIGEITEYVSRVDRGDINITGGRITLYKMISILSGGFKNNAVLNKCFILIREAIRKNEEDKNFSFMDSEILENIDGFEEEKA